jgi:RHS repeat-associated protein
MSGYVTGDHNRLLSDGTYSYTYDEEGNRITRTHLVTGDVETYTWDHRNRLVSVVTTDVLDDEMQRVEFVYDAFDRRVEKRADTDADGLWNTYERFVYDGEHIALVFDEAGSLTNRYLHGPAIDQILADEQLTSGLLAPGDVVWPLTDHLGTVRHLADSAGNMINDRVYDSFGQLLAETNPSVTHRFGFTGREWDAELGLNYHRARYYDVGAGKWISEDPIGFTAGDANVTRYVFNSASGFRDSSGFGVETEMFTLWSEPRQDGMSNWLHTDPISGWIVENYVDENPEVFMEKADWALGNGPGYLESFGLGLGQGVMNLLNGLSDVAIDGVNVSTAALSGDLPQYACEQFGFIEPHSNTGSIFLDYRPHYFAKPEWARGLIVDEPGTGWWDDSHGWSKFFASQGLLGLIPANWLRRAGTIDDFSRSSATQKPPASQPKPAVENSGRSSQEFVPDLTHITGKAGASRNRAIRAIISEDFPNLRFRHQPHYNPFMRTGIAQEGAGTQLGKNSFSCRAGLRNVIIHEELHHRWWERGIYNHHPRGSAMEARFYEVIRRYELMRGWRN